MGIEQITLNEDNTRIDFVYISPKIIEMMQN